MIVEKLYVERFRKLIDLEIPLGNKVTVIAGQNGTLKTTLLGMIAQPFSLKNEMTPFSKERTIDGQKYESKFKEKFKISMKYDKPKEHKWRLYIPNNDIYDKDYIELESISRKEKGKKEDLRFWSTEGRQKGMGYVQCPVIYLSLKRLIPIGEEDISLKEVNLSKEDSEFFKKYHNEILCLRENITNIENVSSLNKSSLSPITEKYDGNTISAGQDDIGKILMAILSFKKLKEKYPNEYKGGLLLIDEIDATLFPAAQQKLTEALYSFSTKFDLQIIFTTHSLDVIKTALLDKYNYRDDTKVIYLSQKDGNIMRYINPNYEEILADLNIIVNNSKRKDRKLRVYTEDDEAKKIAKSLLGRKYTKYLDFMEVTLGCENYKELIRKKVPEFTDNIIILDGDTKMPKNDCNVIQLPGKSSPEFIFYDYLYNLSDIDEFWDTDLGGYNKQVCFKDYTSKPDNRVDFKKWFRQQEIYWGTNCNKLITRWKKDNTEEVDKFILSFVEKYNNVAEKYGIKKI